MFSTRIAIELVYNGGYTPVTPNPVGVLLGAEGDTSPSL